MIEDLVLPLVILAARLAVAMLIVGGVLWFWMG